MAFSRNRPFNNRPTMHHAVCDKCRQDCEVPFKPTSGKPIFCNNCFDRPTSGRSEGRSFDRPSFADKRMFDAVCDECKKDCKVPFQPRGDKPIYCSDCFGSKGGRSESRDTQSNSKYEEQFALLNNKLDQVLNILMPIIAEEEKAEEILEEETKPPKKSVSKKK